MRKSNITKTIVKQSSLWNSKRFRCYRYRQRICSRKIYNEYSFTFVRFNEEFILLDKHRIVFILTAYNKKHREMNCFRRFISTFRMCGVILLRWIFHFCGLNLRFCFLCHRNVIAFNVKLTLNPSHLL